MLDIAIGELVEESILATRTYNNRVSVSCSTWVTGVGSGRELSLSLSLSQLSMCGVAVFNSEILERWAILLQVDLNTTDLLVMHVTIDRQQFSTAQRQSGE
jgi:hypothetical protein